MSLVRIVLWVAVAALAVLAPGIGGALWIRLEELLDRFAQRKALCCATAAFAVLVVRAAFLPVWDIPKPFVYDELGYLLQADTFAAGHLTNPPHPLATFFERPYILQQPTYNAKFPPGQGLAMALGQTIFGHPWFGVWLSCAALAAAICWALQGWFSPGWALFGTALCLPLCTFSYWMNSYWGGAMTAIGGALAFGALPRLRTGSISAAAILAVGATVLALTRPFEGAVVLVPILIAAPFQRPSTRQWAAFAAVALAGGAFLGYYNFRVTGSALRLPYVEYDSQNPSTPHFNILPLPPQKTYRHLGMTWMDQWERLSWAQARSPGFLTLRLGDLWQRANSLLGTWLLLIPLVLFWPKWIAEPRLRPVRWALALTLLIAFLELLYYEHYAAPALAALLILVVAGFRELRTWEWDGKPSGLFFVRTVPALILSLALFTPLYQLALGYPLNDPRAIGGRERIEQSLKEQFGEHVILVRYTKAISTQAMWSGYSSMEQLPVLFEWVSNAANIDAAPVIWAHDLGPEENKRLLDYYKGRTFWLFQPEESTTQLTPYR